LISWLRTSSPRTRSKEWQTRLTWPVNRHSHNSSNKHSHNSLIHHHSSSRRLNQNRKRRRRKRSSQYTTLINRRRIRSQLSSRQRSMLLHQRKKRSQPKRVPMSSQLSMDRKNPRRLHMIATNSLLNTIQKKTTSPSKTSYNIRIRSPWKMIRQLPQSLPRRRKMLRNLIKNK
jgi:hypothetical protein